MKRLSGALEDVRRVFVRAGAVPRLMAVAFLLMFCFAFSAHAETLKKLERRAAQGDSDAQCDLGCNYIFGYGGLPVNNRKAMDLFQKAAAKGNPRGQHNIGFIYYSGRGVAADIGKAFEWFQKAADQGFALSQYTLGELYRVGEGVAKDDRLAAQWYQKAADQGHAGAQYNIGLMYEAGEQADKDDRKAAQWHLKAAEQGNDDAKKALERFPRSFLAAISDNYFFELCKEDSPQEVVDAIANGANVNARNYLEMTPLMYAAGNSGNPEVIATLINAGADVSAIDHSGRTPLLVLTTKRNPNLEAIAILLTAGADVNARDDKGMTPLMWTAMDNSCLEATTALIDAGADVNAKDNIEMTALMFAAGVASPETIAVLLTAGADVNASDHRGRTPLMWAASKSFESEYGLRHKWASWYDHIPEVVTALLAAGADVNAKDNKGMTPLMYAAEDVDRKWPGKHPPKRLPVYYKAKNVFPEVISILLESGADPKAKTSAGKMARDYARKNKELQNNDILKKLEAVSR